MHNPKLPNIQMVLLPTVFDACLCISEFKNRFCNPSITDSRDQSLIGLLGHAVDKLAMKNNQPRVSSCLPQGSHLWDSCGGQCQNTWRTSWEWENH